MLQRLSAAVAWAALAFITYASLSPSRDRPQLSKLANLEHLAPFAVSGFAFGLAYRQRMTFVCSIVLGIAVVLEFLQMLTPGRHGNLLDASEKIIGCLIGIFLASLALRAMRRHWVGAFHP